ncbi:MAG: undecaprenyl-diphosphate phosphatase [Dongiaceae bacterium]
MDNALLSALILGAVEGLTEFLPVSSTGHLILVGDLLNFQNDLGKLFEVVIQLGAILAVLLVSLRRLLGVLFGLGSDPGARRFAVCCILALIPAALLGFLLHDFIKDVLFSPWVVVVSLVVGGFAILAVERLAPEPRYEAIEEMPFGTALGIGICQCLSLIPGVSRAGATILGGVALGVDRRVATEFSFYLAIPVMLGATLLDLVKTKVVMDNHALTIIAVGFVTAFILALVIVRGLIAFVGRHGFKPFAYYRIIIGVLWAGLLFVRGG